MLSEIEELRAEFTTEILTRRKIQEELERAKKIITALVVRLGEKVFISDSEILLLRKCGFSAYRHPEKQGIIIEAVFDDE
jgi:hypothetical protein